MGSRIVMQGIVGIAKPIGETIRRGKPVATAVGGFLGAGLGASTWFFVAPQFVPICIAVGILAGATTGGALFKRPPRSAGVRATDLEPFRLGRVVEATLFGGGEFGGITVLLENALYVAYLENDPWEPVVQKLSAGEDPDRPHSDLIRFDELVRIELHRPDSLELILVSHVAGKIKRYTVPAPTASFRAELIAFLELQLASNFTRRECPLELSRAIMVPGIVAVACAVVFSLIAWASAYWAAHPPSISNYKNAELVASLVSVGPAKILLIGAVVLLAPLAWLASRVIWPPRIHVIQIQEEVDPIRNDPV